VKHLVYGEKKRLRSLEKSKAELSEYREEKIYRTPAPVLDYIEIASQKLVDRGSMKPLAIPIKEPESFTRTIPGALREMVGKGYAAVLIMNELNEEFGTNFTQDDITKMRSEL
jgi:hypothetical protein